MDQVLTKIYMFYGNQIPADCKVIIIGYETCPYFIKAKEAFEEFNKRAQKKGSIGIYLLFSRNDGRALKYALGLSENQTFPLVFDNGQYIGGGNEAEIYFSKKQI